MTTLSLTLPTAGATLNSIADPEIVTAFQTIQTWANGNVDGANLAGSLPGRRLIAQAAAISGGTVGNATLLMTSTSGFTTGASQGSFTIPWWYLDPANYAIAGRANTQIVVRLSAATNSVAPAITFAGGLYAVSFGGSTNNQIVTTIGSLQGTAASIASPGASGVAVAESAAFTFPTAGAYAAAVNFSGLTAANSCTMVTWQLFAVNS